MALRPRRKEELTRAARGSDMGTGQLPSPGAMTVPSPGAMTGAIGGAANSGEKAKKRMDAQENGRTRKWGRHCCRPHSHRCVVPSKRALGIRRFPGRAPKRAVRSVAGARTGIRKHPPVISPDRSGANPFAGLEGKPSTGISVTGLSLMAGALNFGFASDQGSSAPPPRASDRSIRPVMKRLTHVRHRLPSAADRSP